MLSLVASARQQNAFPDSIRVSRTTRWCDLNWFEMSTLHDTFKDMFGDILAILKIYSSFCRPAQDLRTAYIANTGLRSILGEISDVKF